MLAAGKSKFSWTKPRKLKDKNLIQYARESRSSFPTQIVNNQGLSEDSARAKHISSTCKEV